MLREIPIASATAGAPRFFPPVAGVAELLLHVVYGEQEQAQILLRKNPGLLIEKGNVTDYSGRRFFNVSAFQCALWALDTRYMANMMLDCVLESKRGAAILAVLLEQYDEIQGGGKDLLNVDFDPTSVSFSDIALLLENKDGIIFYHDNFYYANSEDRTVSLITPNLYGSAFLATALKDLKASFESMKPGTARRSTNVEYKIIELTLGHSLYRKGVEYELNGERTRDSHYNFSMIAPFQIYIDNFHRLSVSERAAQRITLSKKQREFPAHIIQHYCDPKRSFVPTPDFKADFFTRSFWHWDRDPLVYPYKSDEYSHFPFFVSKAEYRTERGYLLFRNSLDHCFGDRFNEYSGVGGCSNDLAALHALYETRIADSAALRIRLLPPEPLQTSGPCTVGPI